MQFIDHGHVRFGGFLRIISEQKGGNRFNTSLQRASKMSNEVEPTEDLMAHISTEWVKPIICLRINIVHSAFLEKYTLLYFTLACKRQHLFRQ